MHMKEDTRNMPITHDHTPSSPHELDALGGQRPQGT